MKEYIEIIECRDCESKNCAGCNVLTLSQMLDEGKFDSLMDEHHSINPAADVVERKRGEWVVTKAYNDVIEMDVAKYTCSACGEYRLSATGLSQATNFCPNCGADMREVDHETD